MNSNKLSQWMTILIITMLTLAGCGGQVPIQPTETSMPIPPTNTPIPPTSTPLPREVIVLVSPEAMDVISSWNSSINTFTPADNPVTSLRELTPNDVGFWNNSQLGMSLYQEVVKLLSTDIGSPWEGGLYGKPDVNTAFPSLRVYFTDDSVTEIDGAARVVFQASTSTEALPAASTGSSEEPFDLAGVWRTDNLHAPDNSWNISYSVYFRFTNTEQYVYHGVDTYNSNQPTDISDIVYLNINDSTFIKKLVNIPDHPEALGKFQKWTWRFDNGNVLFTVYGMMDSQELALNDSTITALATGVKVQEP